jgi:hypothetical protein
MLNLKTKALYISLFAILILIILNQNSFVFSQSRLPVCVSPGSLIVWPDMTPNTVPMASTSNGILRNSYIKFGTSAYNAYHSIFDTLYIYSQLYSNGNVITNPDENRANWVIVNRGALYTTGPRNNFNSGGAIGFQDYSTDTTKLYHTIFSIDQSPYKFYDNNGNVSTSSSYGILRFHYGEFNPTNATITSPRLGNIPPGRSRWRGGLLSLTWEGNLGIGTTNPSAKLDVAGDAIIRGTTTASRFCLGNNCITNWPSGGTNYWILSGNSLYATPTNVNVGIGTTSPQAKLHVVDSAIISSGEAASLNIKGRGGQNIYNFAAVNLVDDRPNANRIWHITHRSNANPQDVNKLFFSYYNGNRWSNLLAIATSGNVGIGTTSPQAKLHVLEGGIILQGGENVLKITRPITSGGYARGVWFYNRDGSQMEAGIGFIGNGDNPPRRIYLTHGNNGWDSPVGIHILNDGNVGIGTINPSAKLHVVGNVRADQFCLGNNCITNWPSGGTNYWILSGNSLYATPTNVNVGIGTTSPQAKLHVLEGGIILQGGENVLKITRPITSGGYARGVWFYNRDGSQMEAGIGFIGNGDNPPRRIYLTHGNNGWDSPVGIHILNDGNVGIGTINPSAKLHVVGNVRADQFCLGNNCITNWPSGGTNYWILSGNSLYATPTNVNVGIGTTSPQSYIHINSNSSNDWISFRIDRNNSPQWTFGNSSNNSFYIDSQQGGGRVLTLTPSGNVGIGTTNPQSKLHIYSTYSWDALTIESGSSAGINIKSRNNNGAGFIYFTNLNNGNLWNIFHNNQDQNLSFYFYNSSSRNWTHALTLANNGNVGIGTTNPGAKLHVIGSAIIQGSQRVYSSDGSRLLFEITEE